MKGVIIIVILIFTFLFNSENFKQESFRNHYECLKILNPQIPMGNWRLEQHYNSFEKEYYSFYMDKIDTFYNISFYVKDSESVLCEKKYMILEYQKKYSDLNNNYYLLMDYDTLYFYQQSKKSNQKKFYRGKYYYLYSTPEEMRNYKKCQHEYFQEHLDSLVKIRGDNLPELPCN